MADKKSLFDKYKIVGEDGTEKSAEEYVPEVIGGEVIEIPEEEELPEVEALTGFPDAVKEVLDSLPIVNEEPSFQAGESLQEHFEPVAQEDINDPVFEAEPVVIPEIAEIPETETEEFTFDSLSSNETVDDNAEIDEYADIKLPDNLFGDETVAATENVLEDINTEEIVSFEDAEEAFVAPVSPKKEKKVKEPKPPKEKKVKEPKPPKEKKVKEPKPPKVKKEKRSKTDNGDAPPPEPLTMKDHLTFLLAIFALMMAIVFLCVKYFPANNNNNKPDETENQTEMSDKLSSIQVQRDALLTRLVQTDIDNVFYSFSTTYELQYYQYRDNRMVPVQSTGSVTANVDMGNETLPVTIDYVQVGDKVFGIGIFRADKNPGVYFYKMAMFKLTNLPKGYESDGKALLLATTSNEPITQKHNIWPESFTIDLETGKTTRFLSNVNRNIDMTTGAYVTTFCVLTNEGYTSSLDRVPFFTAREYDAGSGKRDIFVKKGSSESLLASNVYGDFVMMDGNATIFLRADGTTGFNVIRKEGGKETTVFSLYGALSTSYLYDNEYLLDKINGTLYNVKTGKETSLVGYRMMSPEMMSVSPDGRYLILLGSVNSIMDYQIHIFDLSTGDYAKYEEQNFSQHTNLVFIDEKTAMYTVVDPNQGFEYVILDVSKAFNK